MTDVQEVVEAILREHFPEGLGSPTTEAALPIVETVERKVLAAVQSDRSP